MRRTLLWLIAALAVAGLGIAGYLTTVHYAQVPLFCPTNAFVNCAQVTQSQYSVIPHTTIPITVPGMMWFAASLILAVAQLRRRADGAMRLAIIQTAWSLAGMLFVLWLVFVELALLHRICEWCSAVHVAIFLTLLLSVAVLQSAQAETL